jgi:shikimate dehydrogenase
MIAGHPDCEASRIDARTQLVGLVGWPVEHSVSPAMHNAAFGAMGLNWCYVPLPVPPGQIAAAVRGLGALGFRGANVTVPHKQAVIPALDSIAPNARELGAVNTLVIGRREDGASIIGGYNTDDMGLVAALRQGGFEPEDGGAAVVLGAGGAARAAVYGLLWSSIGQVVVLSRTLQQAEQVATDLGSLGDRSGRVRALPLTAETLIESARAAGLLINATPVGMWPHTDHSLWPGGVPIPAHLVVCDLVYNPLETRLLQQARQSGAQPIGGLEMLVQQGALAFEMWTGEPPPLDLMRGAAHEALGH